MVSTKEGVKLFVTMFIGVIIGIVLLSASSDRVFTQTNTLTDTNQTVTIATGNTTVDLLGRELVPGTAIVTNATDGVLASGTNYTVATGSTDGLTTVQITRNDAAETSGFGSTVNVTYEFRPDGYANESSSRGVIRLILIFMALGIVVFIVAKILSNPSLREMLNIGNRR